MAIDQTKPEKMGEGNYIVEGLALDAMEVHHLSDDED
jgi:hypothetical protein